MNRFSSLLYMTYFDFAVQYRKTMIGPAWVLLGPTLFIACLGLLFGEISNITPEIFIPHLAIGFISWTLISGFVIGSTTVFQRHRVQIMQGGMSVMDIVTVDALRTVLQFSHQIVIVIAVFFIFKLSVSLYSLVSVVGLLLLIVNGYWLTLFFGIVGVRYRDLSEVVSAMMRIAFLATPIIWMPSDREGHVVATFLTLNPFYHFIELIRAPLLQQEVTLLSWLVVLGFTLLGAVISLVFYRQLASRIALWV